MNSPITPVSIFPIFANDLYIRPGSLGVPPSFYYQLRARAVVPTTVTNHDGSTTITDVESFTVLKDGNVNMTQTQWDNWDKTVVDEDYMLSCVAANLGLTLV